jgi:hypothetical protein
VNHELYKSSRNRRLNVLLIGYIAALMFLLCYLIARKAHLVFELPGPLSEAAAMTIASLMTLPIILPFIYERLLKVKIGGVEIELSQAEAKAVVALPDELNKFEKPPKEWKPDLEFTHILERTFTDILESNIWNSTVTFLREAESSGLAEINIGRGDNWWSTRLFLLATLADEYTSIKKFIFVENRIGVEHSFVGMATPQAIRLALASKNLELERVYQTVAKISFPDEAHNLDGRVAWIAQNFQWHLDSQIVEEEVKEYVTKDFLVENLEMGHGLVWNGGHPTSWLLYSIVEYPNSFVPLTKSNGQLSIVIDRLLLVDHIAKSYLKQQVS